MPFTPLSYITLNRLERTMWRDHPPIGTWRLETNVTYHISFAEPWPRKTLDEWVNYLRHKQQKLQECHVYLGKRIEKKNLP